MGVLNIPTKIFYLIFRKFLQKKPSSTQIFGLINPLLMVVLDGLLDQNKNPFVKDRVFTHLQVYCFDRFGRFTIDLFFSAMHSALSRIFTSSVRRNTFSLEVICLSMSFCT